MDSPEVIDAICETPAVLAILLAAVSPNGTRFEERPWFPELAKDAQIALTARSEGFKSRHDVYSALWSRVLVICNAVAASKPLARYTEKWRGQQWTVSGVYDSSVLGLPELRYGELFLRALNGEQRFNIVNEFTDPKREGYRDPARAIREIVFHGVRLPSNPETGYFKTRHEIGNAPVSLVCGLALCVWELSEEGGQEREVARGQEQRLSKDGNEQRRPEDVDFLLKALRLWPRAGVGLSPLDDALDLRENTTLAFLCREEKWWRDWDPGPNPENSSLFGAIGASLGREFAADDLAESPGRILADERYQSIEDELCLREDEEIERINVRSAELGGIDRSLLDSEQTSRIRRDSASVPGAGGQRDSGTDIAGNSSGRFVDDVQIKVDVDLAFRANPHGRKSTDANVVSDRKFFDEHYLNGCSWTNSADNLKVSPAAAEAAKKRLKRRERDIFEWLSRSYPDLRSRPSERVS